MSGRTGRLVAFDALGPADLAAWHGFRAANPALDSPYFHPGFARAVHESGHPVHVVLGTDADGAVASLLPLHRHDPAGRPVGWPAADLQGPILAPGTGFDPRAALRTARLRRLSFDHLHPDLPGFEPFTLADAPSPYLDVDGGLPGYLTRASRSGRDNMSQARRRGNKAERELGPLCFTPDVRDPALLDRVIALKRAQYAATGAPDYFADPRHRDLVHRLLREPGRDFGGVLATLHAGEHLLAAHFGLRAGPVLHWWFPVYDPAHAHLAPGWQLLRHLVDTAPAAGIGRIDLGRGDDEYKRRAMTGAGSVRRAVVAGGPLGVGLARVRDRSRAAAAASPLGPFVRRIRRTARPDSTTGSNAVVPVAESSRRTPRDTEGAS